VNKTRKAQSSQEKEGGSDKSFQFIQRRLSQDKSLPASPFLSRRPETVPQGGRGGEKLKRLGHQMSIFLNVYLTLSSPLVVEYDLSDFNVLYLHFFIKDDLCLIFAKLSLYILTH
jgi:hypothetical protein